MPCDSPTRIHVRGSDGVGATVSGATFWWRLMIAALVLVLVASSCSVDAELATSPDTAPATTEPGDSEPGDPEPGDPEPGDPEPGDPEPSDSEPKDSEPAQPDVDSSEDQADNYTVVEALMQIPTSAVEDLDGSMEVWMADIDLAAAQADVRRPPNSDNIDRVAEFFEQLTLRSEDDRPLRIFVPLPALFLGRAVSQLDEFIDEMGFSPGDVQTFVSLETGSNRFTVFTGVDVRNDLPEVAPGVRTLGQGEDLAVNIGEGITAARPLGRPLRVGERDGSVALSLRTAPMVDWVAGPDNGTLADDPRMLAMARELDRQDVVSAVVITSAQLRSPGNAIGWSVDEQGPRSVVVFAHDSPAEAQDQIDEIEAGFAGDSSATGSPIAEQVTLESIEVNESLVVAVVRFPSDSGPFAIWQMLLRADGPFGIAG